MSLTPEQDEFFINWAKEVVHVHLKQKIKMAIVSLDLFQEAKIVVLFTTDLVETGSVRFIFFSTTDPAIRLIRISFKDKTSSIPCYEPTVSLEEGKLFIEELSSASNEKAVSSL